MLKEAELRKLSAKWRNPDYPHDVYPNRFQCADELDAALVAGDEAAGQGEQSCEALEKALAFMKNIKLRECEEFDAHGV